MPFELPLPTKRIVPPLPMHAFYATNIQVTPPLFVDGQEEGSVFGVWHPEMKFAKNRNNCVAKPVHGLKTCELTHAQVLINEITWYSICKLPNGRGTFLVRG
jgi:hypothetical protein